MLAQQIPAEKAHAWGLIWDVVDDHALMEAATAVARRLANGPTLSLASIKKALNAAHDNDLSAQLDLERDLQRELGRSEDFKEGVAAFLAKRPAQFKGR
jgi:2-(1,2-epoxy-1,2-dihydrophenyl)acetyl-CoA isomerase